MKKSYKPKDEVWVKPAALNQWRRGHVLARIRNFYLVEDEISGDWWAADRFHIKSREEYVEMASA